MMSCTPSELDVDEHMCSIASIINVHCHFIVFRIENYI